MWFVIRLLSQSKHSITGGTSTIDMSVSENSWHWSSNNSTKELTSSIDMLHSEAMKVFLCLPKVAGINCINLIFLTTVLSPCLVTAIISHPHSIRNLLKTLLPASLVKWKWMKRKSETESWNRNRKRKQEMIVTSSKRSHGNSSNKLFQQYLEAPFN